MLFYFQYTSFLVRQAIYNSVILFAIIVFYSFSLFGQDPHFSQFYASPLSLNPAMTGLFAGDVRIATLYRNQWRTVSTPFTTATVAADFRLLDSKIGSDAFGFGIMGMLDQSNNQGLKSNFLSFSTAYNKSLDAEGYHRIGVGFQGTWTTKRVDYGRFVFSRQFTPMGFDPSLPTGEPINGFSLNYLDLSTGILYSGMNSYQQQWYVGASYYHINKPNEAISTEDNRLAPRLSVHSGFNFPINEWNRLYLSGLYMKSALVTEKMVGTVLESLVRTNQYETKLFFGLYYRASDAIIPYLGVSNEKLQIGLSYDINISTMTDATRSRGGAELSLQLNLSKNEEAKKIPTCYNRF